MILAPQRDFPLVRQIANHLDTATYYVQAIVRDADGAIVDTVNLTDQGSQRFQKRYRVPVDRSGQGAYISIVTSVYTDSGYTTKSSNYGDEENTYLIFDQLKSNGGGGGGADIDYTRIRDLIGDELDKREKEEKEIEFPEMPEMKDYTDVLTFAVDEINAVKKLVEQIPTEKVDLTNIMLGIQNLAVAIDEKEVTPATDVEELTNVLSDLSDTVFSELQAQGEKSKAQHEELTKTIIDTIEDGMENTEFTQEMMIRPKRRDKQAEQEAKEPIKKFNIRDFTS